jgi:hypothetical protein
LLTEEERIMWLGTEIGKSGGPVKHEKITVSINLVFVRI